MKIHKYAFNFRFRKMNELAENNKLNDFRVDPMNDIEELKFILSVSSREDRLPGYSRKQLLDLLKLEYPYLIREHYNELLNFAK